MDSKIFLSIIIPVYNMEQYISRCLDSVVKAIEHVTEPVEVLIINDGSQDHSAAIIQTYCDTYSYMKRFDKKNGGLSDVKNYGLEHATGEYVIFLDSDDYIDEYMYHDMLEKLDEEHADIVICDLQLAYDDAERNVIHPCRVSARDGIFHQVIDMTMMPASWNKIVRKSLYEGLTFPVGKNNEDIAVTPIVLARAKKITTVDKPMYYYYQRSGSIQNSRFDEKRFVVLDTSKICMDRLHSEKIEKTKVEQIKGSVYLHQVLAIALYPIRREKLVARYRMLRKYMTRIETLFPDMWDTDEIKEFVTWDSKMIQRTKRVSVFLLRHKMYLAVSMFWSLCNWGFRFVDRK
ncbi:MAG: glycosyltransferase [Lachnospiraceae bacterium]|nr:glycosyltransferase [Lachnospiraceae bacterium]